MRTKSSPTCTGDSTAMVAGSAPSQVSAAGRTCQCMAAREPQAPSATSAQVAMDKWAFIDGKTTGDRGLFAILGAATNGATAPELSWRR